MQWIGAYLLREEKSSCPITFHATAVQLETMYLGKGRVAVARALRKGFVCPRGAVMTTATETDDDPEGIADTDYCLRRVSRRYSQGLARMVTRPGERVRRLDWAETQVTRPQRRLDRLLLVDMAGRYRRLLHVEWFIRLTSRARERTAEYHFLAALTAREDEESKHRRRKRRLRISVETVVVVLTGRKKPWPKFGTYRTSPRGKRYSGVRFRIEAVYQQTVAELEAKGSLFWLVFVPLAQDADEDKLRRTMATLRTWTNEDEFVEVIGTMMSMAQVKKDRPEFLEVIKSEWQREVPMRHPWFAEAEERGLRRGMQQGRQEGLQEGLQVGLRPLVYAFERRLGRPLRDKERKRIAARLEKDGPEKLAAVVLDLSAEELAAWLAPRKRLESRVI